jgi:hypothetical protein
MVTTTDVSQRVPEEHVDADEAAAHDGKPRMKEDDGQDGNGSQAVDLGTVSHRLGERWGEEPIFPSAAGSRTTRTAGQPWRLIG